MKLHHIITLFFCLLAELSIYAQNNTNSPYTMFGIGYIEPGGFGRNKGMGGTGIALSSELSLNNMNPASYHGLDSLHFLLETGINTIYSKFSNRAQEQEKLNGNFAYLAVGFRITPRWANSIGIAPYSNVGYSIDTRKLIEGSTAYSDINIKGSGGINQLYWGNAYKLTKNLSLGMNVSYLFGSITQTEKTTNDYFSGNMTVERDSRLRNIYFDFGAQYAFKVNENWGTTIGAVYGNKTRLSATDQITILDFNSDTLSSTENKVKNFYIPQFYGIGASVKFKKNLVINADYRQSNWSGLNKSGSGVQLGNSNNMAVGIEFVPSYRPSATYYQVLRYRLGGYKENSYMRINGQQLTDYGITAGIGFPIMKGKTFINLAFAAGKKGAPGSGAIINENYYKINLNFTLVDFWFNRLKFD